jgi:hypothetical protein
MRSYHRPILLDTEAQLAPNYDNRDPKRFEAKWFHEQKFREVVQRAWNDAAVRAPGVGVLGKLGFLHGELHAWDDAVRKTPKKQIRQAQRDLDNALSGPMNDENEAIAKQKAALIELLLEQQEVHWLQRSRANWLRQGDRNTSFSHQFALARRKKNRILKLKNDQNILVEGTEALKPFILEYFSNLFSSEVHMTDPAVLEKIVSKVDQDMNDKLLAPFSYEDVKKAIFSIGDLKAPGLDGLHAIFYKKFWDLFGDEIS